MSDGTVTFGIGAAAQAAASLVNTLDDIKVPLKDEVLITKDRAKQIGTEVEMALEASRARIAEATSPGFRDLAYALDAVAREREAYFDARIPTGLHRTAAQAGEDAEVDVGESPATRNDPSGPDPYEGSVPVTDSVPVVDSVPVTVSVPAELSVPSHPSAPEP
ncbi:hypothetical protein [Streptomyces sp. NBC_01408]|uniref:hypothetical protein n=1 Tax=Streptomyces sp. NBC_01408 TaxID=2903855 RepID=UPI0022596805|nr:hypothetical protein [Streptomyces sp. NBC_01408]MCX4696954.1 hypothetical protein [Streptomyces sp. NBC_01408]